MKTSASRRPVSPGAMIICAAAACAAATVLSAFACLRVASARNAARQAMEIRAEIQSGPLAAELAAEDEYRAAVGALVAAAAAGGGEAPRPQGAVRAVRGAPLMVEEGEFGFSADTAEMLLDMIDHTRAGGATRIPALSLDMPPGGRPHRFHAHATIRTFFLP